MKEEKSRNDRGWREHHHGRHHHPENEQSAPGEGRPPRGSDDRHHGGRGGRHGGGGRDGFGGARERAKRGEAKYILLDALRDGPKHGYEIIKGLDMRSGGDYVPSPGTVYPTMQYLEEAGLVTSSQEAERRSYQLTDTGRGELATQAEQIEAFWSRFTASTSATAGLPEIGFLREDMENLQRSVWGTVRSLPADEATDRIRDIRQAISLCREQVRDIISQGRTKQ